MGDFPQETCIDVPVQHAKQITKNVCGYNFLDGHAEMEDAVLSLQQQQAALAQPVVPQVPGLAEHIAAEAALVALQEQQAAANAGWNMNMNMEDWMRF